jgi:hypothetical protein
VESQLDLHRLQALNREFDRLPPVDGLVAAYLGYEAPETESEADPPQDSTQAFSSFERLFSAAGGQLG